MLESLFILNRRKFAKSLRTSFFTEQLPWLLLLVLTSSSTKEEDLMSKVMEVFTESYNA